RMPSGEHAARAPVMVPSGIVAYNAASLMFSRLLLEARMRRSSSILAAALAAATLAAPAATAQQFKTQKFNIGGEGAFDYLSVDPTGRVFVSRSTHIMVVDGSSGKVLGDIPNTPRVHGAAFVPKWNHGFTTNGGDSTSTMFDLKTLAVIKKIPAG